MYSANCRALAQTRIRSLLDALREGNMHHERSTQGTYSTEYIYQFFIIQNALTLDAFQGLAGPCLRQDVRAGSRMSCNSVRGIGVPRFHRLPIHRC